jgi:hypothetical protein
MFARIRRESRSMMPTAGSLSRNSIESSVRPLCDERIRRLVHVSPSGVHNDTYRHAHTQWFRQAPKIKRSPVWDYDDLVLRDTRAHRAKYVSLTTPGKYAFRAIGLSAAWRRRIGRG